MLKVNVRAALKCPKHPRFNPGKNGPDAYKAGCTHCSAISRVYRTAFLLSEDIRQTLEGIQITENQMNLKNLGGIRS